MLVARTTIGSAPRTTLIWVRVKELGLKRKLRNKLPGIELFSTILGRGGSLVLQNQWMRTLLHALRVVGSTLENDLNLRF